MDRATLFKNRRQAGKLLAQRLAAYANRSDVLVLALPRGGVPVAFPVAKALHAPLDVLLVRKLGVPGEDEFAMGAIASDGTCVLQHDVLEILHIPQQVVAAVAQREMKELQRRQKLYRADRPAPDVRDRVVILVDDGIATGTTMLAAVLVLRDAKPSRVVVAVPVAASDTLEVLRPEVDELICLLAPEPLQSVGQWYENFEQTTDDEVKLILKQAQRQSQPLATPAAGPQGKKH